MYLNEVFALRLSHQWLKLRCGEGVDEPGFRHDEEKDLGAGQYGQLVCLEARWQPND